MWRLACNGSLLCDTQITQAQPDSQNGQGHVLSYNIQAYRNIGDAYAEWVILSGEGAHLMTGE